MSIWKRGNVRHLIRIRYGKNYMNETNFLGQRFFHCWWRHKKKDGICTTKSLIFGQDDCILLCKDSNSVLLGLAILLDGLVACRDSSRRPRPRQGSSQKIDEPGLHGMEVREPIRAAARYQRCHRSQKETTPSTHEDGDGKSRSECSCGEADTDSLEVTGAQDVGTLPSRVEVLPRVEAQSPGAKC